MSLPSTVKNGAVSDITQVIESSNAMRVPAARPNPMIRAERRCVLGSRRDKYRNENDVVDAEPHLERREGAERNPGGGISVPVQGLFTFENVARLTSLH